MVRASAQLISGTLGGSRILAVSRYPLRGLDKSRGDFTHVEIVSTTDTKKRPEIDVSPQDENIFETIFLIGHCGASISRYKYPERL